MGRKNTLNNYAMFGTAGADLGAATVTSNTTEVQYLDNVGIIVSWTGTSPVGTLTVDASNDQSTWVSLDFGGTVAVSGNTGSHNFDINQFPYTYIRSKYTKTSGTGTLNAALTVKQIG